MKPPKKKNNKKQNKPNLTEMSILPEKEFKIMMIAVFTKLGSRMNKLNENFNKKDRN